MKISFACCCAFLALAFLSFGCRNKDPKGNIPDIESIYSNISYLDSLIHSSQTDSISRISDQIGDLLVAYTDRALKYLQNQEALVKQLSALPLLGN
jgi:hypothetical protein